MRTTLSLEADAIDTLRAYAEAHRISLGKAASELIRRGTRFQLPTKERNGLPVFEVPGDFAAVTAEQVRELLDEE